MAPKKPTMLQRQRALRKQQQQTKQQASKQLPPKGDTSANTRQARGQRTSTAKAQAANQQRVIARGMEGFVRRGQAMDKLDKAAKGTQGSGTRTAGAGGGLAKRQSSAVTTRQSGKPATSGGQVRPSTSGGASSNRVQQVRVRDLGTTKPDQMGGSTSRALPPGRAGDALARTRGAASAVAKGGRGAGRLLGPVGTALAAADTARNVFNPKDNIITRGAALGRSIERVVGSGGGSNMTPGQRNAQLAAKRGQRQGPQQTSEMVADYKAKRDARHQSLRDNMPPAKPRTSTSSGGGNSSPSRSSATGNNAPRTSTPRSQTPPAPRFTGTVDEGRKMWAEKYSSSKYDGQAIQKEAKKLLDEMKKRKEDKSNATKAGWDGNKNY